MIDELATLRFIEEKANVLLIGPPGVGKTHLAVALGHQAVEAGYRVYYTTAADLVARTARAAIEGRWQTTMRFWNGPQAAHRRRARLPADARPRRLTALPGHQPPLRTRLDHPDHQPRHRRLGRRSSKTPPSPPRSSTASYTTPPSSRSPATATACAATATPSRPPPRPHRPPTRWGIPIVATGEFSPSLTPGTSAQIRMVSSRWRERSSRRLRVPCPRSNVSSTSTTVALCSLSSSSSPSYDLIIQPRPARSRGTAMNKARISARGAFARSSRR